VASRDFNSMPAFQAFKSADHFYNVAFHSGSVIGNRVPKVRVAEKCLAPTIYDTVSPLLAVR